MVHVRPLLLLITEKLREILTRQCRFQNRHNGAYSVQFCVFPSIQHVCLETRLPRQVRPASTLRIAQMTTTILLFTSALDLNLKMLKACGLSGILFPTVLIRAVQLQKDCMPSGRAATLNFR
jgi:hypothetical protein